MTLLKKSDFYYNLPEELIAQLPVYPRDHSRMLVYDRASGQTEHRHFYDIVDYLKNGDVLVVNDTKVLPARIYGYKKTGAKVEFLLHKRLNLTDWEVLVKPARKAKPNEEIIFSENLKATVLSFGEEGLRTVRFEVNGVFEDELSKIGEMPLPPYIHEKLKDKDRYQTVYANKEGSSAAPTAGLHFTDELLQKIESMGVTVVKVLLHVGLGTFRPVKTDNILDHKMHSEFFCVSENSAKIINNAKSEGRRVIACGTTSVRVLESATDDNGLIEPKSGYTQIFIYPPYKFKMVDALITNFHLPESTLVMLVSAFIGKENALEIYKTAVNEKYRFFSFGDACLFL